MAALVEGQQYGLSAQDKINCTKSVVFVKLTDSALRSIEEYVKNKGDANSRPTIQFQNSNGVISLPQHGNSQKYGFTLSNVEADGPHGSFECLRQTAYRSLESLGCLQVKMHIHANEDSYENTRVKMAAVEKEQKKSCTKVIKPAGAHLGRKIKVKRPGLVVSPMKSSPPTASMVVTKPPLAKPSPIPSLSPPDAKSSFQAKRPEIPKPNPPKKNPELMRQPIRDRIIHILAVRPYKRPELLVRLNHEGVREKDKNKLTSILPQLSTLKGNIYYLANYLWNEVQDNWKFCTQEELEIIKKRKQQHLNTSSESETPPSYSQSNNSPAQKRPTDIMLNGNLRSKKQRISHYKGEPQRPSSNGTSEPSIPTFNRKSPYSPGRSSLNINSPEDDTDTYQPIPKCPPDNGPSRLSPNQQHPRTRDDNPRSREDEKGSRLSPNNNRLSPGLNHPSRLSPPVAKDKPPPYNASRSSRVNISDTTGKPSSQTQLSHPPPTVEAAKSPTVSPDTSQFPKVAVSSSKTVVNGYVNSISRNGYSSNGGCQPSYSSRSKVTSTTNGSCSNSPHSSCDSIEYSDEPIRDIQVSPPTDSSDQCDSPEYEKEYGRIVSSAQRAQYKEQFNAEYQEYLHLHQNIIKVSNNFAKMERTLRQCPEGTEEYKIIKQKIFKDYRAYQQDPKYLSSLKKFNFLHNKLAYIKRVTFFSMEERKLPFSIRLFMSGKQACEVLH
ncbi:hypothetical protein JTE90_028547 [Oedothorax gibbosus]|uniref:OCEL domain-containing protein n=1 Tax=Oedothorax gibbosus TaxID=931172 RepID=A0AAV6VXT5_9ARAC|nr:hypothetical protein JTE90_028547 [Oedothorax gibbosus]